MYIYSLFILALTLYLIPGVRKQDPWSLLAFAQTYALDTLINAFYTLAFALSWFAVVATHDAQSASSSAPQAGNVSSVTVVAVPAPGLKTGQDAIALGKPGFVQGVLSSGGIMSLFIIVSFEALRVYAAFVALSYARQVLRRHVATSAGYAPYGAGTAEIAGDPFVVERGWKGKIGRVMVAVGREYWLGREESEDEEWMRSVGGKFRKSGEGGPTERERRRRSGTDPPKPAPGAVA